MSEQERMAGPAERLSGNDRYAGAVTTGLAAIAICFGGLAAWSVLAPLSSAAIAPGALVVEGNRKTVQHLEGGIVKEILVRDGDRVEAGQPLMLLDTTQTIASLKLLHGRFAQSRALEARLEAERDGRERLEFPDDLETLAREDADVALALAGQRRIFEARRASLQGQLSILQNRIAQSKIQIAGLSQQEQSKAQQAQLFARELDGIRQLFERGVASGKQVLALERDLARLNGERGETVAQISQVRQAIGESNLQIHQIQKSFDESVAAELKDAQAQVFEALEKLNVVRDTQARQTLKAPAAGKIVDLAVHTVGGVVQPGAKILDIVPDEEALVVEARVSPADIDGLQEGLPADLRFVGLRGQSIPVVGGTVSRVSADRMVNPRTEQPYFVVRVSVSPEGRETLAGHRLVPGLPVEAIINKGERTLLSYFLQPFTDVMSKALRG